MNVRKDRLFLLLAEAIADAIESLRACIEETPARLSAVEVGIRSAAAGQEARSRRISELKRAVGIPVDDDVTAIGRDA